MPQSIWIGFFNSVQFVSVLLSIVAWLAILVISFRLMRFSMMAGLFLVLGAGLSVLSLLMEVTLSKMAVIYETPYDHVSDFQMLVGAFAVTSCLRLVGIVCLAIGIWKIASLYRQSQLTDS